MNPENRNTEYQTIISKIDLLNKQQLNVSLGVLLTAAIAILVSVVISAS